MIINVYPDELDYVNAKLHPLARTDENSFLWAFLQSCLRADPENYELIRPVLWAMMVKYPADEKRLEMERRDSGR